MSEHGQDALLSVESLSVEFGVDDGVLRAVRDVSFEVGQSEVLAIVGESGSGKSVTMLAVMGLLPKPPARVNSGRVLFQGRDLLTLDRESMRRIRGRDISMIFQEPLSSLNPVFTIGNQIREALTVHGTTSRREADPRILELLDLVKIGDPHRVADAYPHQLSGGMCQRVMLAMALSCNPKILIADEPTTALDITTQAQLLDLIRGLRSTLGMSIVWITHDLGLVAGFADTVAVMYAGRVVEQASVDELYAAPSHPYTRGLIRSIPRLGTPRLDRLTAIPGVVPDMTRPPPGCAFAARCSFRLERCGTDDPQLESIGSAHARACWAPLSEFQK